MGNAPTGTVTFLFTDIEGSTERWERHPDGMARALARHDALLRGACETRGGYVFKTVGDAMCAAFPTALAAVEAAVDGQVALRDEPWAGYDEGFEPLRVRMGIHTGAAQERDGDYFGPPLNRCARLQAAGHGGQVLLSLAVQQLLRDKLPASVRLRDLGKHRLRDLRHSEHIFQVVALGLEDVVQPLQTPEQLHVGDRIFIDVEAEQRSFGEALAALRAVVLDAEVNARLTPAQVRQIIEHRPRDVDAYRLSRVAAWSQPRHRVDGRFVALELLVDRGETSVEDRWEPPEAHFEDLGLLLGEILDPALVLLGPPGAGKSTLLRRFELDTAIQGLVESDGSVWSAGTTPITFYVQLNHYRPEQRGGPLPSPEEWLVELWRMRYPDLPALSQLLAAGRIVLLLDALNEMPIAGAGAFREGLLRWKDFVGRLVHRWPGNRVVISCRSLDYSQPLSTPALRVPQVRIEALNDQRVRHFLQLYSPLHWRGLWRRLEGSRQLDVMRSPYFLRLLTDQVEASGEMPEGRAGLFTGFVRQTMRREVELEHPLFGPDTLVAARDIRRITHWKWRTDYELPERGVLLPKLSELAFSMQSTRGGTDLAQVRVSYDEALQMLDDEHAQEIVQAGVAISVLDEDPASDEVMFVHQLVQEYFAARRMAVSNEIDRTRVEWRAGLAKPELEDLFESLDPADPLPGPAQTGWEETALLAAAMADDPSAFVAALMETNLALAGRAAAQTEVATRLSADLLEELRGRLVRRSRSPEADLRDRILCGYAVGDLGDPRFELREGPNGPYALPLLVSIPAGAYPIGEHGPIEWVGGTSEAHVPQHPVELAGFEIGAYPVTNAEWAYFLESGGYDEPRYWDTAVGRRWRRGEGTSAGTHADYRYWRTKLLAEPELMDRYIEHGVWDQRIRLKWLERLRMNDVEFEAHLAELYPDTRHSEPRFWRDARFNHPAQPVAGICWYEARAYVCWLSEQSGRAFRLPTEAEWEAAARGPQGRPYACGDAFDRDMGNTLETHIRRPTPVGVFPRGDTPQGVSDLTGNNWEWTSSAFGASIDTPEFGYPYRIDDGREEPDTSADIRRVVRGGSWNFSHINARAAFRVNDRPDDRSSNGGLRVVASLEA